MISSLSIWDGGHECSVHVHSFEKKKKTVENKIYQASCCVWPVYFNAFQSSNKRHQKKLVWFFFIQFFLAMSVYVHYKKKKTKKKLKFIGS